MSTTLAVNVRQSIQKLPLKAASCEAWGALYPARPATRIVAFDRDTWLGEFVSRSGGFIRSVVDGNRRCFDPDDMVAADRTCYGVTPFARGRLPFRRLA